MSKDNVIFESDIKDRACQDKPSDQQKPATTDVVTQQTAPLSAVLQALSDENIPIVEQYRYAVKFMRSDSSSATPTYQQRVALSALSLQISRGPAAASHTQRPPGWLDVTGRDIQCAWSRLGPLSVTDAMRQYVQTVADVCAHILPYIIAQVRCSDGQPEALRRMAQAGACTDTAEVHAATSYEIRAQLNAHTARQFQAYARQEFPDDHVERQRLVAALQEEHYRQYVRQVVEEVPAHSVCTPARVYVCAEQSLAGFKRDVLVSRQQRPLQAFSATLKLAQGQSANVRVQCVQPGQSCHWMYASDGYDIGFGVFFEPYSAQKCEQTVQGVSGSLGVVVELSDSESEYEEEEEGEGDGGDVGTCVLSDEEEAEGVSDGRPDILCLVEGGVLRYDSHKTVQGGSHLCAGRGQYVLRFDNSYSMWRSKTIYYRVSCG